MNIIKKMQLKTKMRNCDYVLAGTVIKQQYYDEHKSTVINRLIDEYMANPCFDEALKLIEYNDMMVFYFTESCGEGLYVRQNAQEQKAGEGVSRPPSGGGAAASGRRPAADAAAPEKEPEDSPTLRFNPLSDAPPAIVTPAASISARLAESEEWMDQMIARMTRKPKPVDVKDFVSDRYKAAVSSPEEADEPEMAPSGVQPGVSEAAAGLADVHAAYGDDAETEPAGVDFGSADSGSVGSGSADSKIADSVETDDAQADAQQTSGANTLTDYADNVDEADDDSSAEPTLYVGAEERAALLADWSDDTSPDDRTAAWSAASAAQPAIEPLISAAASAVSADGDGGRKPEAGQVTRKIAYPSSSSERPAEPRQPAAHIQSAPVQPDAQPTKAAAAPAAAATATKVLERPEPLVKHDFSNVIATLQIDIHAMSKQLEEYRHELSYYPQNDKQLRAWIRSLEAAIREFSIAVDVLEDHSL